MGKVLLTGGNGFVAMHVVIQLLEAGHTVVTTVRSTDKARDAEACVPANLRSKLSYAIVGDAGVSGAFDQVIKENDDIDGILHTATPFHYNITDPHELFDPAVIGTKTILEAAHQYAPKVTRVVILSSFASVVELAKGPRPGFTYTEADWNPITEEKSLAGDKGDAYFGAKTWAEKAAWKFVETVKPKFTIATLCPPYIFGAVANHVADVKDLGTSNATLYSYINGSRKGGEIASPGAFLFVNVKDIARAHVAAYERPEAANERFLIMAGNFNYKKIGDIFAELYPDRKDNIPTKLPPGFANDGYPEGGVFKGDNSKSVKLLGMEYSSLEQTIKEFMDSIKAIDKA